MWQFCSPKELYKFASPTYNTNLILTPIRTLSFTLPHPFSNSNPNSNSIGLANFLKFGT